MKKLFEITASQFIKQGIAAGRYSDLGAFFAAAGVDAFRIPGLLQGGFTPTDVDSGGTIVTDAIKYLKSGNTSAPYVYGYGSTGRLYRLNISSNVITLLQATANAAGNGLEFYKGAVYYATDAKLGKMTDIEGSPPTFNDTFASFDALTAAGSPHPLHEFSGSLWCGDGSEIDKNDGTTHTDGVLLVPSDYTIIDIDDDGTYLVILAVKKGSSSLVRQTTKIFFWDTFSPQRNFEYTLPEGAGTAIGKSGIGREMVVFAGAGAYKFSFASAPGEPFVGGHSSSAAPVTSNDLKPVEGAVGFLRGCLAWASNGNIWTYGRVLYNLPRILSIPLALSNIRTFYVDGFSNVYASAGNKLYNLSTGNQTVILNSGIVDLKDVYRVRQLKLVSADRLGSGKTFEVAMTNDYGGSSTLDYTFNSTDHGTANRQFWSPDNLDFETMSPTVLITMTGAVTFRRLEAWGEKSNNLNIDLPV